MRTVIAGGHGKVGLRLGALLAQRGDQPVGLVRAPEQAPDLEAAGVEPLVLDLVARHAAAAGRRPCRAPTPSSSAPVPAAAADPRRPTPSTATRRSGWSTPPSAAGVRRFVLVSVFMDAGRGGQVSRHLRELHARQARLRRPPRRQRPGLDHPAAGHAHRRPRHRRVHLGPAIGYGDVRRDDVAAVLAELLHAPGHGAPGPRADRGRRRPSPTRCPRSRGPDPARRTGVVACA